MIPVEYNTDSNGGNAGQVRRLSHLFVLAALHREYKAAGRNGRASLHKACVPSGSALAAKQQTGSHRSEHGD